MNFDEYEKLAARTATFDNAEKETLYYLALGIAGEAGEVVEKIKKIMRNDKGVITESKKEELVKEMGDVLWYLSQLSRFLGKPFSEVARINIEKLADRQKRGVIASEGDNR